MLSFESVPVEMETEDRWMPLCCLASTLRDADWSVVGSVVKGSIGDVCKVGGTQAEACLPHLGTTEQCFPKIG